MIGNILCRKDIKQIDGETSLMQNWFSGSVKLKLGDGKKLKFWKDKWRGPWQLMEMFPRLFVAATDQNEVVADTGEWCGSSWVWKLKL